MFRVLTQCNGLKGSLVRHFRSSLTYFLGRGSARSGELVEELGKILTGELPFKGPSRGFPIVLKVEEALREGVEIGKIVGRENLPLDNREIDFDLVEPTGMNGGMHERESRVESS